MRMPGSVHYKKEPTLCRLLELHNHPRYSRDEFVRAFDYIGHQSTTTPQKKKVLDGSIPEGERNATLFQLVRGFVNKGLDHEQVLKRIQAANANKCATPLCASEVDSIVLSVVKHGPSGFLSLPIQVFDSFAYRKVSHAAQTIAAAAYRRYNGENNGNIGLSFDDFSLEFTRKETFYKARKELENAGLIIRVRTHGYVQGVGWRPDLYEIALSPPNGPD
jgi:hypothetical protein